MAANTRFVVKRSSTSGKTPNTADPANSSYIAAGELALNMTDKLIYTSDGSSLIMFGSKRVSASPNATNQSNSSYIAAGDFAIDPVNKKVYSSTGSEAFEVGSSISNLAANKVNFTDTVESGDINTNLMRVNATAIFVGNTTTNTSVNNSILQIIDPDHSTVLAADTIKVTNTTSNISINPASISVSNTSGNSSLSPSLIFVGNTTGNSKLTPASIKVANTSGNSSITPASIIVANTTSNSTVTPSVIFVGNSTSNAQFNLTQGSGTFTVTSYSYDPATLLTTFNLSSDHNFTTPIRGTQVTISNMTGSLANYFNNKTFDVNTIPNSSSFTVKLAPGVSIATSSATVPAASRTSRQLINISDIVSGGFTKLAQQSLINSVDGAGVLTFYGSLTPGLTINTPIYVPTGFAGLTSGAVYYVMSIDSVNLKATITSTPGGTTPVTTTAGAGGTVYCHTFAVNIPLNTTLLFTDFKTNITGQTGAAAIAYLTSPVAGLTLNFPYYITDLVLTDKSKFVLSTTPGGSALTGLTPSTYQIVNSVQQDYNFSAVITGIATITTAVDHPYVSGATVKVTGLGNDLPGLTLDGEYSIIRANSSVFYYKNNPYTSIFPTGMYIDNNSQVGGFIDFSTTTGVEVWAASNSSTTTAISTTAGIITNPIKLTQSSLNSNSLIITGSTQAQFDVMNQIVFSAYDKGGTTASPTYTPIASGTNFNGIELGKLYWLSNTSYTSPNYTFNISDTLTGPTTTISYIDSGNLGAATATKILKASIRSSTLNFVKQAHGLTNSSIISGAISAYANSTVSYICAETPATAAGLPTSNVYIITNDLINDYFNYNANVNYTLANSSIVTNIPVTAYSVSTALPTYATPGTPSTSIIVTIPKSSIPGLYAGYVTIPDNSFVVNSTLNTTTVYSTPYDIIAVKSSGVVTVSSITGFEKGQRILISSGAGTGTGLTTSSIYYANSISGSDITLSSDGYTTLSTTATPSYTITAVKASGVVTVSSVTGLTTGTRIKTAASITAAGGILASTAYIISGVSGSDITLTTDGSTLVSTTATTIASGKYISFNIAIQASIIKNYTTLLTGLNGKTLWFVDNGTVLSNTYKVTTTTAGTPVKISTVTNPGSWITCDSVSALSIGQQIQMSVSDFNFLYANRYFYIKDINTGAKQVQLSESYGGAIYYVQSQPSSSSGSFTPVPNIVTYGGSQTNSTAGILKFIGNSTPQSNIVSGQYSETVIGLKYNGAKDTPTTTDPNYLTPIFKLPVGTTTPPYTKLTFTTGATTSDGKVGYSGNTLPFYVNSMVVFTGGTVTGALVANSAYYITDIDSLNSKITISNTRGGTATTLTNVTTDMNGHGHITIGNSSTGSDATNFTSPYLNGISVGDYILYNTDQTSAGSALTPLITPAPTTAGLPLYITKTVFQVVNVTSNSISVTYKDPSISDGVRNRLYKNNQAKRLGTINPYYSTLKQTVINKFYPITQTDSKVWINYKNTLTNSKVTVTNSSSFYVPFTKTDKSNYSFYYGNFGTYANQITLQSDSYFYTNTEYSFTTTPNKAATAYAATSASGTSFNANSNFSSYVEIANTSAAVKITPTTFYIGNTVANLYSNSSFLSINAPTNLFQVTPSYMLFSKAVDGVEDTSQSYFYAGIDMATGATSTFIGTNQKYTAFDGAGNQKVRGSSITVTNDIQSTYIDDYSVSVFDLGSGACTSITPSAAVFGGSVDINGPINLQGTSGTAGQTLLTDGIKSYWGDFPAPDTSIPYNFTSDVSISGQLNILNDVTYKNSSITYRDDDNNYINETSKKIDIVAITGETTKITSDYIEINTNDLYANSTSIKPISVTVGNSTVNTVVNSTSFTGTLYANSSTGAVGQVLRSNGSGAAYWDDGSQATNARQTYTADGSTVTFTVTAGYTPNNLDVYLNGVKLQNGTEVSATDGTTFTINSAPASGSIIEVVGGIVAGITTAVPYVATTDTSVTINPSVYNGYFYTALASGLTINASTTGSPVNGTRMIFRFKDSGTVRSLTWTTTGAGSFRVIGTTLPTTTTSGKITYVACIYNADEQYWDVVAVAIQA